MMIKMNFNENINFLQEQNEIEQYNIIYSSSFLQIVTYHFFIGMSNSIYLHNTEKIMSSTVCFHSMLEIK